MKRISLRYIVVLISIALLVLVGLQLYQAKQLYNQKSEAYAKKIENTVASIAYKHEKVLDFKTYAPIFGKDFKDLYKNALKEEFQNIYPVQETVSIIDTTIFENGNPTHYYFVDGKSFDSLSGVTASHSVLVKDFSENNQTIPAGKSVQDSLDLAYKLDRKVKTQLMSKSNFVNNKMVEIFRSISSQTAQQRIDLSFLDSIIKQVLKENKIKTSYSYALTNQVNEIIKFPSYTDKYNKEINLNTSSKVRLFPHNVFDNEIYLNIKFNARRSILLKEMWLTLVVSALLIALIIISFYVMFKTILNQRRLSEMKNDFINNMTHEFKTPISTISLACEALGDKDMIQETAPQISPFVNMINDENKRLGNLVERILQSAIIDRGELNLKKENLDLNDIVSKIAGKSKLRLEAINGNITLNLATGSLPFLGDNMHTTNIISNLVDNAIKYSKASPKITIETKKIKDEIVLVVKDNGIGIKSEHLDKIFDKLYRVPTGNVHDVKGFGLGLSYVKAITEIEGWQVKATSKFGEGSVFKLIIKQKHTA